MRKTISAVTMLALGASALAADALPSGWTQREDGAYVHQQTGTVCGVEIAGLKRTSLEQGTASIVATCSYRGDDRHRGTIRIRNYTPGEGETPMAIQNDRTLMEPPASPDRVPVSAIRMPPVPDEEGTQMQRLVITVTRAGLLIDCDGTYPSSEGKNFKSLFSDACTRQFDPK
jgi:hypothetical protein